MKNHLGVEVGAVTVKRDVDNIREEVHRCVYIRFVYMQYKMYIVGSQTFLAVTRADTHLNIYYVDIYIYFQYALVKGVFIVPKVHKLLYVQTEQQYVCLVT